VPGEGRVSRMSANAETWASNIVASADTRMYRLVRERSRIAKQAGSAGPQRSRDNEASADERRGRRRIPDEATLAYGRFTIMLRNVVSSSARGIPKGFMAW
jgi:hypothetical protein